MLPFFERQCEKREKNGCIVYEAQIIEQLSGNNPRMCAEKDGQFVGSLQGRMVKLWDEKTKKKYAVAYVFTLALIVASVITIFASPIILAFSRKYALIAVASSAAGLLTARFGLARKINSDCRLQGALKVLQYIHKGVVPAMGSIPQLQYDINNSDARNKNGLATLYYLQGKFDLPILQEYRQNNAHRIPVGMGRD